MKDAKIIKAKGRGGRRPGAGRPKLAVTLQRQIEKLCIAPEQIDPEKILASIALDPSAPAAARVSACRTLIDLRKEPAKPDAAPPQKHEIIWNRRPGADA
ncbi:hypothetical protein WOC76_11175 [Methylocystis sp. IM3]|uniref:hypothetical protein n=1 Tax=unclassified Methylocystis TaxID=2625913 RepID=UPI0030F55D03